MDSYFQGELKRVKACTSAIEVRVRVVSSTRLLIQQVVYALAEWISIRTPEEDQRPEERLVASLLSPTDGTLVDALEVLAICCERLGWTGASRALYRGVPEGRPCDAICLSGSKNLMSLLRGIVVVRNDGAEGHGIPGEYNTSAEIDALEFIIESLRELTPIRIDGGDALRVGGNQCQSDLRFLRMWNGRPALIRKLKILASDRVRVSGQISNGDLERSELNVDATNPLQNLRGKKLPAPIIWANDWSPICFLPDRTTDSFTGRHLQLEELTDWFNDVGSRACLVFGDGGLGKTTLVVEFLHQVLDEDIRADWKPKVVLFYTAKRTQWNLDGLEAIGAGQPHLMELLSHLHMLFFGGYPAQEFYRLDTMQAAANLQQKVRANLDLRREEILVVVDNAETLIQSDTDRITLGKELREVTKRIGRVILTSRRREILEASPIAVDPLSEDEAVAFLRERASRFGIQLIRKATDDELKAAVLKLERRPIVLEAFVKALTDPSIRKMDQATNRVVGMLGRDLGEFLFADAWSRLKTEIRRLLLLMTQVADVHDAQSLKICARIIGVSPQSAEEALQESGGIASLVHIDDGLQISFSRNFLEYARSAIVGSSNMAPSSKDVGTARQQYSSFVRSAHRFTGDRIAQAFRTPQAKAAHRARQDGNLVDAKKHYEQALLTDPTNGWLFDRYAYFLFHDLHDIPAALHRATKAVELLPDEGEVWYTRGLLEARLGDIRACERSLNRAESLGIDVARCLVQKCWAYLKSRPKQLGLAERELLHLRAMIANSLAYSRLGIEADRIEGRLRYLKA